MRARLLLLARSPAGFLTLALVLGGCAGTSTPFDDFQRPSGGAMPTVVLPNAVAGDAAARGEVGAGRRGQQAATVTLTAAQQAAIQARRRQEAERLYGTACRYEAINPAAAADVYKEVVEYYPEFEFSAEARFRQGRSLYRSGQYSDAFDAFRDYMLIAPVNPHLADVEQMLYRCGVGSLRSPKGLFGIFKSDETALSTLEYVAETFPAGDYADDALLVLGDYYRAEEDYPPAALQYRELLLRYPDSEWSFKARLNLAETYVARDRGDPYDAGFVDLDPREPVDEQTLVFGGPVRSALELGLEQYDIFLERMEADPARAAEYRCEIEYVQRKRQEIREKLAGKAYYRAEWYRNSGCMMSAVTYYRQAASYENTQASRLAMQQLAVLEPRLAPSERGGPCGVPLAPCPPAAGAAPLGPVPVPVRGPARAPTPRAPAPVAPTATSVPTPPAPVVPAVRVAPPSSPASPANLAPSTPGALPPPRVSTPIR